MIDMHRVNSLVGTEEYLAPETLLDKEVGYECDYWSLGVILYKLIYGFTPFKGQDDKGTFRNIQASDTVQFPEQAQHDALAQSLISSLLVKDPTLRLGFEDISEIK